MVKRVRRVFAAIPRETLLQTMQKLQRHLNLGLEANVGNFEHLVRG